jgi:UDP-N-acetylglucosamine acyltransferase
MSNDYQKRWPGNAISPLAYIHNDVQMGKGNSIGPYCIIGGPAEWKGHEVQGRVIIGDNNTFTGLVTVDSGAEHPTVIGSKCYLMKHSHVGHDAKLGDGVTLSCGAKIGGHTVIGDEANIGLNAVIHQKQNIPAGVMIGMGAVVTKKAKPGPYEIYAGNPAKYIGENQNHPSYTIYLKDSI